MIGTYRFKPGVGKHEHVFADGTRRYLTPGEIIKEHDFKIAQFDWKFDVIVRPLNPDELYVGPSIVEIGNGFYDVFDGEGNRMNTVPVKVGDALALKAAGAVTGGSEWPTG